MAAVPYLGRRPLAVVLGVVVVGRRRARCVGGGGVVGEGGEAGEEEEGEGEEESREEGEGAGVVEECEREFDDAFWEERVGCL